MKLSEIHRLCEPYFDDTRNETICRANNDVDEAFIFPVDRHILAKDHDSSLLCNIDVALKKLKMKQNILPDNLGCSTWPYGKIDNEYPRFLAICRGNNKLGNALNAIKVQSEKIAAINRFSRELLSPQKTVILLTDKWDFNKFMEYEIDFLNHALRDGIWYIFLLVTEYGYTQIPFLPGDRHMLDKYYGEKIEDDLSMDDIYRYLKDYPFEYHFSTTLDMSRKTDYIFNVEYMTWEKHSFRGDCGGYISRKSLNALVKKLCWIIDSKETSISFYNSKGNFFKLKIFGKTVEWDYIPEYEEKNIKELTVAIRKFIEECEKNKG